MGDCDLENVDIVWNSARVFAHEFQRNKKWGDLPLPPARKCIILTCIDARILTDALFGIELGETHVIRNAGGSAEAALRDIVVSQQFLGTDEIFVVKHDGCGMLIATNDEFLQGLQANAQDPKADFSEDGLRAVEAMEFYSIKDKGVEQALEDDVIFLANHPAIKGSTAVHGMVYNPSTGRMRQLFANSQPVPPEYGQEESSYEDFMEGEFRVELAYPESGDDPEYAGQLAERCGFGVQDMDGKGPFTDADLEYHGNLLPQGADLGKGGLKSPSSPVNTTKVAGTRSKKAADEPAKSNKRKAKEAVKEDPKTEESAAEEPVPEKKATKGRPRKAAKVAEPKPTKKKSGKKA